MFWNLMFIMAATVSSCDLINVGPKIIPRLDTVIMFWSLWEDTLHAKTKTEGLGYIATYTEEFGKHNLKDETDKNVIS